MTCLTPASPKFIVLEDNSCVANGHYNELGTQILSAATQAGYATFFAGHYDTPTSLELEKSSIVLREFKTRRMTRWSCGIDGRSSIARNESMRSINTGWRARWSAWHDEHFVKYPLRPSTMFQVWVDDCLRILDRLQPTSADTIVLQTADDFSLLALAYALKQRSLPRLSINAIFHFPITHAPSTHDTASIARRQNYESQINRALQLLAPHQVQLFATTPGLTEHLNAGCIQSKFSCMVYPVRHLEAACSSHRIPVLTIGGIQRPEQGSSSLGSFLESIYQPLLATGRVRLAIQLCPRRWKRHVPQSLHAHFKSAVSNQIQTSLKGLNQDPISVDDPVQVYPPNLNPQQFHRMLSASDVILFLYDPARYRMRCSSVLLETMAMGIPAMVPDGCSLAEKVREFETEKVQSLIYQHTDQLRQMLDTTLQNLQLIQANARLARTQVLEAHAASRSIQPILGNAQASKAA